METNSKTKTSSLSINLFAFLWPMQDPEQTAASSLLLSPTLTGLTEDTSFSEEFHQARKLPRMSRLLALNQADPKRRSLLLDAVSKNCDV